MAAVDPLHRGADLGPLIGADAGALVVTDDLGSLTDAGAEVAVDFTRLEAARVTLAFCADARHPRRGGHHRVHRGRPRRPGPSLRRPDAGAPNCIVAANFAIGAVLMMRFAELAAPFFDGVEIIELHHDGKLRRPVGHGAERPPSGWRRPRRDSGSGHFRPDPTVDRGAGRGPGRSGTGRRAHPLVRLPGLVAHQEVIFGASARA